MKAKIINTLYSLSLLLFITAFGFQHNPPSGWYQQFMPADIGGRQISDIFFLDSLTGWAVTPYRQQQNDTAFVMKTTNGGNDWFVSYWRTAQFVGFQRVYFLDSNTGFVCGTNHFFSGYTGLSKSTDGGFNWQPLSVPDPFVQFNDMSVLNEDTIWLTSSESSSGGVYRTTNGGANWVRQLNAGGQNPDNIYFYNKDTGYAAQNILYKTTNSGENWFQIPGGGFGDMHFINALTGWKSYGPIQKTTDGGLSWTNQTLPVGGNIIISQIIGFLNINNDTLWGVGGDVFYPGIGSRGMIYRTTNSGENWLYQVPDTNINIVRYRHISFYNQLTGWAYSSGPGVHTTVGGDSIFYPITNITQIGTEVPISFKLHQNYPNPFNPVTNIKYELRSKALVILSVFDMTGKLISELVNQEQSPGSYLYSFDGTYLPSGVYFYRLEADNYTETRKMSLIK